LLEPVELPFGHVLYESDQTLSYLYLPTTAIISLLYVMENGESAEIAVVGNDGLVGISLFMGGETTPSRAVVQSAGLGFRLGAQALKDEFGRAPYSTYCSGIRRRSSRIWHKRQRAIGTTRSTNNCAADCS
jgi:hypothetical protein